MGAVQKQAALFLSIIIFVAVAFLVLLAIGQLNSMLMLVAVLVVLFIFYLKVPSTFVQINEYERAVVFRKGRFKSVSGPGWVTMVPFIDTYQIVNLRTVTDDVKPQEVVTKDNIKVTIDAIIYTKVKDPKAAVLNVEDYRKTATSNIVAALRTVVGQMELSQVISNIDEINKLLKKNITEVTKSWGVEVEQVEIQSVTLPKAVQDAMHALKAAQQTKMADRERAEGTKIKLDALQEAGGKLTSPTLQYMYLQSLGKIAEGKSSKIIFPMELSRLAESLVGKFGGSYEKAQDKLLDEYHEKAAAGEKKNKIVEELKEEYGIKKLPEPKKPAVKKGKPKKK
ncbi:MAG: SPFH domain-containing protein [Candidatus Micrarchaeota archaeon]